MGGSGGGLQASAGAGATCVSSVRVVVADLDAPEASSGGTDKGMISIGFNLEDAVGAAG